MINHFSVIAPALQRIAWKNIEIQDHSKVADGLSAWLAILSFLHAKSELSFFLKTSWVATYTPDDIVSASCILLWKNPPET